MFPVGYDFAQLPPPPSSDKCSQIMTQLTGNPSFIYKDKPVKEDPGSDEDDEEPEEEEETDETPAKFPEEIVVSYLSRLFDQCPLWVESGHRIKYTSSNLARLL